MGEADVVRAHAIADYETLRTGVARDLARHVALLADGMAALAAGNVDVAAEFMERAHDAMLRQYAAVRAARLDV